MVDAMLYFTSGKYYCSNKRDLPNILEVSGKCGVFVDEIVPFGSFSVWFYHGNPIAMYDRVSGGLVLGNCGFKSVTTKERLNSLPGVGIYQRQYKWIHNGDTFKNRSDEIMKHIHDYLFERLGLNVTNHYQSDAWRGWRIPVFAVAGSSDTGMFSDSPAPSNIVSDEIEAFRKELAKRGIRSYIAHSVTSNVFCMKRWVIVRGRDFERTAGIVKSELSELFNNSQLLYAPW